MVFNEKKYNGTNIIQIRNFLLTSKKNIIKRIHTFSNYCTMPKSKKDNTKSF